MDRNTFTEVHREQRDGFDVVLLLAEEPDYDTSCMDEAGLAEFREKVASGTWIVFQAKVAVELDGEELGNDYLGGCCYLSAKDFRENSGYYEDMVNVAMSAARIGMGPSSPDGWRTFALTVVPSSETSASATRRIPTMTNPTSSSAASVPFPE